MAEPTPQEQEALQERYLEMKLIEKEADKMKTSLSSAEEQLHDTQHTIAALDDISKVKSGEEVMIPLANGIFARGIIQNTKTLLVGIGAQVVVQKDVEATKTLLEKKIKSIEQYREFEVHVRALAVRRSRRPWCVSTSAPGR